MQKMIILLKKRRHYLLQIIQATLQNTDVILCFVTIKKRFEAQLQGLNHNMNLRAKLRHTKNEVFKQSKQGTQQDLFMFSESSRCTVLDGISLAAVKHHKQVALGRAYLAYTFTL